MPSFTYSSVPRAEEPAVESAGVAAGHEYRTDQGKADLAAVVVAREHQVDPPALGLVEEVGRMAEQDAEVGRRHVARVDGGPPGR